MMANFAYNLRALGAFSGSGTEGAEANVFPSGDVRTCSKTPIRGVRLRKHTFISAPSAREPRALSRFKDDAGGHFDVSLFSLRLRVSAVN
jgi:hypothetical protein